MKSNRLETRKIFSSFFEPSAVAVIGSFLKSIFGGYVVVKSLLKSGYAGKIFPVNPGYKSVLNLRVYGSLEEIPDPVELAILIINAKNVIQVIRQCASQGIRAVIVVADGFAERNQEGAELQREMVKTARELGVRIIGPNTAGVLNAWSGFNPCPYDAGYYKLKRGPVAICSQTGMTNPQAFPYLEMPYGISKICDFGNKSDLDECDLLEFLKEDNETRVISMYLESIKDGRRFMKIASEVATRKPVLVLKSGKTPSGAAAASSHTGSMAIDDKIFNAVCLQCGILRLNTFSELFEMPKVFAAMPLPKGNRMAIITYTGGVGVLATDEGAKYGLTVPGLSPVTQGFLEQIFPMLGRMPVDIGPMTAAVKNFSEIYPVLLKKVLDDENVDSLLNVLWADPTRVSEPIYLKGYDKIGREIKKPIVTWVYGPSVPAIHSLKKRLEEMGFPVFPTPEMGVRALGLAWTFVRNARRH